MDINSLFPSNYLKASDLQNQPRRVVIESCAAEAISDTETKPVLRFLNVNKALVLNRTNAAVIASALGSETDNWRGKEIELFEMLVPFQGRLTPAIRVRALNGTAAAHAGAFAASDAFPRPAAQPQAAAPAAQPAPAESPPPQPAAPADPDDDIQW